MKSSTSNNVTKSATPWFSHWLPRLRWSWNPIRGLGEVWDPLLGSVGYANAFNTIFSSCVTLHVTPHIYHMNCDVARYFFPDWSILIMWTKSCSLIGWWVKEATVVTIAFVVLLSWMLTLQVIVYSLKDGEGVRWTPPQNFCYAWTDQFKI